MAILDYQITVYGIYIEIFMNKKCRLTRDNLQIEKNVLKCTLRYFTEWKYQRHMSLNDMGLTKAAREKFFIVD